jgi:hypothetical protein
MKNDEIITKDEIMNEDSDYWRISSITYITDGMYDNISELKPDKVEFYVEIGINTTTKNKSFRPVDLFSKFQISKLRPRQIPSLVSDGIAICPSKYVKNENGLNYNKIDDFVSCQVIIIDFNNCYKDEFKKGVKFSDDLYFSYADAKKDDFLKTNCSFIHTTGSHTRELNRFRAFFILPFPIVEQKRIKKLISALVYRLNSDIDSSSITQIFFGNSKCEYTYFGNILNTEVQEELLDNYKLHVHQVNNI